MSSFCPVPFYILYCPSNHLSASSFYALSSFLSQSTFSKIVVSNLVLLIICPNQFLFWIVWKSFPFPILSQTRLTLSILLDAHISDVYNLSFPFGIMKFNSRRLIRISSRFSWVRFIGLQRWTAVWYIRRKSKNILILENLTPSEVTMSSDYGAPKWTNCPWSP